jgi:hypothetical protein
MADVNASDVSVRVRDFLGNAASITSYADFATTDTFGAATTALQQFQLDLDAVTGAVIEECFYKRAIGLTAGLKSAPIEGAPNMQQLLANFSNAQDKTAYSFAVPALDPACITAGGPDVASGASIDTLLGLMTGALAGTTGGHFTTNRDGNLSAAFNAKVVTRKHRKQLDSKSSRTIG